MESSIITKMKVPDLRNKLIEIGLESKGLKAVLVARLNQYYETCRKQRLMTRKEDEEESNEAVSTDESSEDIDDEKTNKEDSTDESSDDDDDDEDEQNEDDEDEQNEDEENDDDDEDAIVEVVSNANPIQKLIEKVTKLTKRNKNTEYVFINKYDHNELAIKAIEEEKIWNKGNKKDTKSEGVKQNYVCKFHKSARCKAKCFLLYHNDTEFVSLYKSSHQHNEHIKNTDHGISQDFKVAIDGIYEVYKKPTQIKRQLVNMFPNKSKELFPTEQQLVNSLKYKRIKAGLNYHLDVFLK